MLAVEAIMKSLAKHSGEDELFLGLSGLLHDVDFEKTATVPEKHTILAEEILGVAFPEDLIRAIKTHNYEQTHLKPNTTMEKALIFSDAISGLLVACALAIAFEKIKRFESRNGCEKVQG